MNLPRSCAAERLVRLRGSADLDTEWGASHALEVRRRYLELLRKESGD